MGHKLLQSICLGGEQKVKREKKQKHYHDLAENNQLLSEERQSLKDQNPSVKE